MKKVVIIGIVLISILFVAYFIMMLQTKSNSPEETVSNDAVSITYCRPYKNERELFGKLVPYGEVWRTGANEATTFKTTKKLIFNDGELPEGSYSLWTVPGPEEWKVIFNSEVGQWGIKFSGEPNRDESLDVLSLTVPVLETEEEFEQFTIMLPSQGDQQIEFELVLAWGNTMISVPTKTAE